MVKNHRRNIIFSILTILLFTFTATTFAATYEYDDLNRLKRYVSGGIETVYTYDGNGNRESKAVVELLPPSVTVAVNTTTNVATVTVTAGDQDIDYVYIDWFDGTAETGDPTDIDAGTSRNYSHNYSLLRESIYSIRVKVRTIDGNYNYLTVKAQTY